MGLATQAKIKPCCIWASDKTKFRLKFTSSSSRLHTQLPQFPLQQECGASMPALRMVSSKGIYLFHWIRLVAPAKTKVTSTLSVVSS